MNTEEILENTEEVEASEMVEDTEVSEESEVSSETVEELLLRLLSDDGVAAEDPEESVSLSEGSSASTETIVVDYTEELTIIHTDLIIIFMVLIAFFSAWVFRSLRVYLVKGGRL